VAHQEHKRHPPDPLTLLLLAVSLGLAFLPVITIASLIVGLDPGTAVAAMAGAYGTVASITVPIYVRRRANPGPDDE
jgi:hypothetical protein